MTGRGFLALPREVLDVASPEAWFPGDLFTASVYAFLANAARYSDATVPCRRQKVVLKTGQLLLGEQPIADAFGVSRMRVRNALRRLEGQHRISLVKSPLGTLVTVCDYVELFQTFNKDEPTKEPTGSPPEAHREPNHDKVTKEKENNPPHFSRGGARGKKEERGGLFEAKRIGRVVWSNLTDPHGKQRWVDPQVLDATSEEIFDRYGIDVLRHVRKMADNEGQYAPWRQSFTRDNALRVSAEVARYLTAHPGAQDGA